MAENYLQSLLPEVRPTPRNKLMGLLADALTAANDYANKPDKTMPGGLLNPPLAAMSGLLSLGSLATTADRMSYGEKLTNAGKANVPLLKPETADALMMAPISPRNALAAVSMGAGAVDGGMLKSMMLYHGSNFRKPLGEIVQGGGNFGGLFASTQRQAAGSHGDFLYRMTVPDEKVLHHGADTGDAALSVARRSLGNHLGDDDLRIVASLIEDDKAAPWQIPDRLIGTLASKLPDQSGVVAGDASWYLQRLRGEMARELGFDAVAMSDEFGTSYLVNKAKPRPYNQNSKDLARGTWQQNIPQPPTQWQPEAKIPGSMTMDQWRAMPEADKARSAALVSGALGRRDLSELARYGR